MLMQGCFMLMQQVGVLCMLLVRAGLESKGVPDS